MGIPLARSKLLAFALSGFIAGYAGVCLAFATERFSTATFDPAFSILVVSMVVIGGLGSIDGAVLGAVYLVGIPAIFGTTPTIQFLTSGIGLLAFILYLPGGLADLLHRFGDLVTQGLERLLSRRATRTGPAGTGGRTRPARRTRRTRRRRADPRHGGRMTAPAPGIGRRGGAHRTGAAGRDRGGGRLRRRAGRGRCRPLGRARGHHRPHRTQRLGQDHPARRHLGAGHPGRRLGAPRRGEPGGVPARGAVVPRRGALVPGLPALPGAVGGGRAHADARRPPPGRRRRPRPCSSRGPGGPSGPSEPRWTG